MPEFNNPCYGIGDKEFEGLCDKAEDFWMDRHKGVIKGWVERADTIGWSKKQLRIKMAINWWVKAHDDYLNDIGNDVATDKQKLMNLKYAGWKVEKYKEKLGKNKYWDKLLLVVDG